MFFNGVNGFYFLRDTAESLENPIPTPRTKCHALKILSGRNKKSFLNMIFSVHQKREKIIFFHF